MNEQHYIDAKTEEGKEIKVWRFGRYAQCETLLHEMVHHEQQVRGKDPYEPGKITHNRWRGKALLYSLVATLVAP